LLSSETPLVPVCDAFDAASAVAAIDVAVAAVAVAVAAVAVAAAGAGAAAAAAIDGAGAGDASTAVGKIGTYLEHRCSFLVCCSGTYCSFQVPQPKRMKEKLQSPGTCKHRHFVCFQCRLGRPAVRKKSENRLMSIEKVRAVKKAESMIRQFGA